MHEYRAKLHEKYGRPDIAIWLDAKSSSNVEWLISYFDSHVQAGVVFREGETIQIGWMLVSLRNDAEGRLAIWEPRLDVMPIQWVKGANNTLRHVILQRAVCEQVAAEPSYPSLRQTGVVSPGFLDGADDFHMSRDGPVEQDSGWVFTEPGDSDGSASLSSLFEVGLKRSTAIPFLALPPGASVTRTATQIDLAYGAKEVSSRSNEFLARLLSANLGAPRA